MSSRAIKTFDLDEVLEVCREYRDFKEPLLPLSFFDFESGLHGEDTILNLDETRTAVRPWRSMAILTSDSETGRPYPHLVTNVPPAKQRAYVKIPGDAITLEHHGPGKWRRSFLLIHQNEQWVVHAQRDRGGWRRLVRPAVDPDMHALARIAFGCILWREYSWQAVFRQPGSAPFVVPTTASGALTLFRLRDKPDDGGRRPALRHWVANHLRRPADPAADKIPVREHLRGKTQFHWSGINVELAPSQYDIERAALAAGPSR